MPAGLHKTIDTRKKMGGRYARAGDDGRVSVTFSPGSYYVLLLSSHTRRPSKANPNPKHLADLARFFDQPDRLIGLNKYEVMIKDFYQDGDDDLSVYFGKSGKPRK